MAKRASASTGTELELASVRDVKDTMELVTAKLKEFAQTKVGEKPYFS